MTVSSPYQPKRSNLEKGSADCLVIYNLYLHIGVMGLNALLSYDAGSSVSLNNPQRIFALTRPRTFGLRHMQGGISRCSRFFSLQTIS